MKECPSCKKVYSDGAESCPVCYLPLMPKQETWPCPDCGEQIPVSVTRCFHCGGGLEYGPEPSEDAAAVDWQAVEPEPSAPRPRPVPATGGRRTKEAKRRGPGCVLGVWILLVVLVELFRVLLDD